RNAMNRRVLLQQRLEIARRDHIWKFDEFDVVALRIKGASRRCPRLFNEVFLFIGSHPRFPAQSPGLASRQMTAPVTSFSRCMLLRSIARRSAPPSRAPALGLTRPQTCLPSSAK